MDALTTEPPDSGLHITDMPEVSLPLTNDYTASFLSGDPRRMGLRAWGGLTVQAPCLSGYSHYPPPQPPADCFVALLQYCKTQFIM